MYINEENASKYAILSEEAIKQRVKSKIETLKITLEEKQHLTDILQTKSQEILETIRQALDYGKVEVKLKALLECIDHTVCKYVYTEYQALPSMQKKKANC